MTNSTTETRHTDEVLTDLFPTTERVGTGRTWIRRGLRLLSRSLASTNPIPMSMRLRLLRVCGMEIGHGTQVRPGLRFAWGRVRIGELVYVNEACFIEDYVEIGDRTWIGPYSRLVTSTHDLGPAEQRAGTIRTEPIRIGSGCWLGASVTVLPGVIVGDGCAIAAGAVVREDCRPDGLYAGVPARRKRDL